MTHSPANFAEALASIEKLPVDDQAALIELLNKRISAARRQEIISEVAKAREDYASGNVKRGSSADLMRDLRGK